MDEHLYDEEQKRQLEELKKQSAIQFHSIQIQARERDLARRRAEMDREWKKQEEENRKYKQWLEAFQSGPLALPAPEDAQDVQQQHSPVSAASSARIEEVQDALPQWHQQNQLQYQERTQPQQMRQSYQTSQSYFQPQPPRQQTVQDQSGIRYQYSAPPMQQQQPQTQQYSHTQQFGQQGTSRLPQDQAVAQYLQTVAQPHQAAQYPVAVSVRGQVYQPSATAQRAEPVYTANSIHNSSNNHVSQGLTNGPSRSVSSLSSQQQAARSVSGGQGLQTFMQGPSSSQPVQRPQQSRTPSGSSLNPPSAHLMRDDRAIPDQVRRISADNTTQATKSATQQQLAANTQSAQQASRPSGQQYQQQQTSHDLTVLSTQSMGVAPPAGSSSSQTSGPSNRVHLASLYPIVKEWAMGAPESSYVTIQNTQVATNYFGLQILKFKAQIYVGSLSRSPNSNQDPSTLLQWLMFMPAESFFNNVKHDFYTGMISSDKVFSLTKNPSDPSYKQRGIEPVRTLLGPDTTVNVKLWLQEPLASASLADLTSGSHKAFVPGTSPARQPEASNSSSAAANPPAPSSSNPLGSKETSSLPSLPPQAPDMASSSTTQAKPALLANPYPLGSQTQPMNVRAPVQVPPSTPPPKNASSTAGPPNRTPQQANRHTLARDIIRNLTAAKRLREEGYGEEEPERKKKAVEGSGGMPKIGVFEPRKKTQSTVIQRQPLAMPPNGISDETESRVSSRPITPIVSERRDQTPVPSSSGLATQGHDIASQEQNVPSQPVRSIPYFSVPPSFAAESNLGASIPGQARLIAPFFKGGGPAGQAKAALPEPQLASQASSAMNVSATQKTSPREVSDPSVHIQTVPQPAQPQTSQQSTFRVGISSGSAIKSFSTPRAGNWMVSALATSTSTPKPTSQSLAPSIGSSTSWTKPYKAASQLPGASSSRAMDGTPSFSRPIDSSGNLGRQSSSSRSRPSTNVEPNTSHPPTIPVVWPDRLNEHNSIVDVSVQASEPVASTSKTTLSALASDSRAVQMNVDEALFLPSSSPISDQFDDSAQFEVSMDVTEVDGRRDGNSVSEEDSEVEIVPSRKRKSRKKRVVKKMEVSIPYVAWAKKDMRLHANLAEKKRREEMMVKSWSCLKKRPCRWHECDAEMNSAQTLWMHVDLEHGEDMKDSRACQWNDCEEVFSDGEELAKHMSEHVFRPFSCIYSDCKKIFWQAEKLLRHVDKKHDQRDQLRPSFEPSNVGTTLLKTEDLSSREPVPAYMALVDVACPPISKDRHYDLGPWVLRRMCGSLEPYRSPKRSRAGKARAVSEEPVFLERYDDVSHSLPRAFQNLDEIPSRQVTRMCERGLILWYEPKPGEEERPDSEDENEGEAEEEQVDRDELEFEEGEQRQERFSKEKGKERARDFDHSQGEASQIELEELLELEDIVIVEQRTKGSSLDIPGEDGIGADEDIVETMLGPGEQSE